MPHGFIGNTDEAAFEWSKRKFEASLKNQFEALRRTNCPYIGKPCIGCDCTAYREPVKPFKDLTGEGWFSRWYAKTFNKPFTEPYIVWWWLARCDKEVFSEHRFIVNVKEP